MAPSPNTVRFADFEFDLQSGELRKKGERSILLPDQLFRTLAAFVRRPGVLVTRDDLRRELWSESTFVDFDHGLNAVIKRLRELLGDSAAAPRFIQTLPRRGYRFIVAVETTAAQLEEQSAVRESRASSARHNLGQGPRSSEPVAVRPAVERGRLGRRASRTWPAVAVAAALVFTAGALVFTLEGLTGGRWARFAGWSANNTPARSLAEEVLDSRLQPRPSRWPTDDPQAYQIYVRARELLDQKTAGGAELAERLLLEALSRDPGFALAHAALAEIYLPALPALPDLTAEDLLQRGTLAAERALALDSSLPEAHLAMAALHVARWEWDDADREYQRALTLEPSNSLGHQQFAYWLSVMGRFDEGLYHAQQAELLDPLSPRAMLATAGVLRFARRYSEAVAKCRQALALDPQYPLAFHILGLSLQGLGRLDEAIEAYHRAGRGPSGNLGHAYALAGRTAEAGAFVTQLEQRYAATGLGAGHLAQIYVGLGDFDRALQWLEREDQAWPGGPSTYQVAAVWDPLRDDPRFMAILERRGLTPRLSVRGGGA